ncbi:cytochrome c oxidase subunit II [Phreatobacter stygius]|uniref:cytochrome-c oxidase n=1 Tax=Phreatobacter stygius TaxID=1940610 RepID=A0A4D7BHM9_9HYPH|nr:cytochrome c oxidase subunit II [Phreatobacter stygius]QCI67372.1 cytochrome c oxidase subunit II [Phreatobacter stygius]
MPTAIILLLVAVGSVLFHIVSPWWWTPIASNWSYIDHTLTATFWITGAVFFAVVAFMAYCIFRFRHVEGRKADYEPENRKLESWLTVATAIGVTAMLVPGLFVWHQFITVPAGAAQVEVMGQQWRWSYRLPGADGRLGTSDVQYISAENPLGLNPNDPNGKDDVIIDGGDLHFQIGRPIKVLLRSVDVLHNFYVPEFRAKMDMVPGSVTYFWFTPIRAGEFDVLCAELCGLAHSQMRGKVIVESAQAYNAWLAQQKTFAEMSARSRTAAAERQPDQERARPGR